MPGIIDQLALMVVASIGTTSVAVSNAIYLGTVAALGTSVSRTAIMIGNDKR
ncbi:hypothetical protein MRS76_24320 [Rhizobiaceae bacterium n13]|uniref:hypothetical protein n=1 Tax=Ferirhizobium litorale TaxID=2927786 RepID=UPI0024B2E226|nr:hypothetical protein [Fererhizobium litorale]MDI7865046.1 hypothetical protein [Fererhizobium litorale]